VCELWLGRSWQSVSAVSRLLLWLSLCLRQSVWSAAHAATQFLHADANAVLADLCRKQCRGCFLGVLTCLTRLAALLFCPWCRLVGDAVDVGCVVCLAC
jgi:hypothetical protein